MKLGVVLTFATFAFAFPQWSKGRGKCGKLCAEAIGDILSNNNSGGPKGNRNTANGSGGGSGGGKSVTINFPGGKGGRPSIQINNGPNQGGVIAGGPAPRQGAGASPWGGYPTQKGYPQQGYPTQKGYPPQGYPPQGYLPQKGSPPQGYPPQGQPVVIGVPSSYSPQGAPPQGGYSKGPAPIIWN